MANPDIVDLYQLLQNPDKSDELDPDHMLNTPISNYLSFPELNDAIDNSNSQSLFSIHCNMRSLSKNLSVLHDLLNSFHKLPDIIAVTETKLSSESTVNVDIANYSFLHIDSPTNAGGTGLYLKNTLKNIPRPDIKIDIPLVESCWAEIESFPKHKPNILIGCIYRHPGADLALFTNELENVINQLNQNNMQILLLGDFNIDLMKYGQHPPTEEYLDMIHSYNLLPLITKPTRITDHTSSLIDHIYTNSIQHNVTAGILVADVSDHLPIFCITDLNPSRKNTSYYMRDYSQLDKEQYLKELESIPWSNLTQNDKSLNDRTANLIDAITDVVNKHAPLKLASNRKMKKLSKPWLTKGILKSIKTKQKLYYSHFRSKNDESVKYYKSFSNLLNHLKNKAKKEYYCNYFQKYKDNLKNTWKLIGSLIKRKSKGQMQPTAITRNGNKYTDESDIADQFNQHFVNVGPSLANLIQTTNDDPTKFINNSPLATFSLSPVSPNDVLSLFTQLKTNKASLDIPIGLIKSAGHILCTPFTHIYNESITTGKVPDVLKISRVTPIFKSGSALDPSNYRPISTLSPFSKVLERLVYNQLNSYLEKHEVIYKLQFGFRKGYSTEHAILEITDQLKASIDNKLLTCGWFIDFSKAFDTVNHSILIDKLKKYGMSGPELSWFTSYLQNRKQYVKIGNCESDRLNMVCGVPQGSTLGPLLFLLYINDLPNCSNKLSFRLFADDTNIFFSCENSGNLEKIMNEELNHVFHYCHTNKLSINLSKSNYMIIAAPTKKVGQINIQNIERKPYVKYLGIFIDEHLNWHQQISHVSQKISKI